MKNQSEEKEEATALRFSEEPIEEKEILYANKWFGRQRRGEAIYQWQDFNSQTVIGETVIDLDRKSTRLNSSHVAISYAVFCLKKQTKQNHESKTLNNHTQTTL